MHDAQWDMVARTPGTYLFPVLRKSPPHLPTRIQTSVLLEGASRKQAPLEKALSSWQSRDSQREAGWRSNQLQGRQVEGREAAASNRELKRAPCGFQLELSVNYGLNKDQQHQCESTAPVWTHGAAVLHLRGGVSHLGSTPETIMDIRAAAWFFFFLTVWYSRLPHKLLVFFFFWFILIKDFKSRGLLFLTPWLLANGFLNTILIISFLWNSPFFITAFAFVMCTISWLPITRL